MSTGGAQIKDMEIGVVVPSLLYAPISLAERRGFLAEEGLRVQLRSFGNNRARDRGASRWRRARYGGVSGRYPAPAMGGADLRLCAGFVNEPPAFDDRPAALSLSGRAPRRTARHIVAQGGYLPSHGAHDGRPWPASAQGLPVRAGWSPPAALGGFAGGYARCSDTTRAVQLPGGGIRIS